MVLVPANSPVVVPIRVTFAGQSLNYSPQYEFTELGGRSFPGWAMENRGITLSLNAISGFSFTDLLAVGGGAPRLEGIPRWADWNIISILGGQSDIFSGDTGAQIMADIITFVDEAKGSGFDYVIANTIQNSTAYNGSQQTARQDANDLIRADSGGDFDAIVDMADDPLLEDAASGENYFDGLHPWRSGTRRMADLFEGALNTAIAAAP